MFEDIFGSKDERVESFLYSRLHHYFGLPSEHAMNFGRAQKLSSNKPPMEIKWGGSYIRYFSISGKHLTPQFFMINDRHSVYNMIDRDITVPAGRRFAYDVSKIQEGTLSASLEYEGSPALQASDERRHILDIIRQSGIQDWKAIPLVYVETGPFYAGVGIPDRIYLQLPTVREASPQYRNNIMQNIANHYDIGRYDDITINVQQDRATSSMNFVTVMKQPEPQFPYDYYFSIGLIDNEGMVLIDTVLGKMRIPANSEQGREHLLKAGQEGVSAEKEPAPVTQEISVEDIIQEMSTWNKPQSS